ncbi:DNA polymerase I [Puteibacter caeruleilacunae]|nr:DNA polymerase I [Puteibacter caeruleilacunae]
MAEAIEPKKKLFLLDAYALIYRAYYALYKNPRFNSKKLNTSAIMGFTNTLDQLIRLEKPTHIAVAFDMKGPTFRHQMFETYKANRQKAPEEITISVPHIKDIISGYNIPILECAGFEADDVIGTMSRKAEQAGFEVYMMTPDKDYAQLVTDHVFMYKPAKSGRGAEVLGKQEVAANFGLERPDQVIDYLGLMGDSSDNIPGCPGVGPKSAAKLLGDFGSIDGIYNNIDQIKGKQKEKLIDNEELVRMSRKLVEIVVDVPVEFNEQELKRDKPNVVKLYELFKEYELKNLEKKLVAEYGEELQEGLFSAVSEIKDTPADNDSYYTIITDQQRASLRAELAVSDEIVLQTLRDHEDPHQASLVALTFWCKEGEVYHVPLPKDEEEAKSIIQEFKLVLEDPRTTKVGYDLKQDILMLKYYDIELEGALFDVMIARYLLRPEQKRDMEYLAESYLELKGLSGESVLGKKGKNRPKIRLIDEKVVKRFCCEQVDFIAQLKPKFIEEFADSKTGDAVAKLFHDVEMPLLRVLADMEKEGVRINPQVLIDYQEVLEQKIDELSNEIHELVAKQEEQVAEKQEEEQEAKKLNLNSPKQLGELLFDKMDIEPKPKKTKTGQYSTNEEVLVKLKDKHPIINTILEYRMYYKLKSTYVEPLPKMVNEVTGKIHASFNQTGTATGRLSSNNPNLQNMPIRDIQGQEIRRAFIPSDDEHIYLSADYSQIELRLIAALSKDPSMIATFKRGEDIHTATAAKIYGVALDDVTADMRRKAKTANFGIVYGISAFGLSQRLNIPRTEAKELIEGYYQNFPDIKGYMDGVLKKAQSDKYVETILGRRRYVDDINSQNAIVRGVAERNAINAPVQGSAADLIKMSMIGIWRRFKEKNLQSKMTIQVHDELNFDVLKTELEQVEQIVREEMENVMELPVRLSIDMRAAANWLEAH